jgi:hypothetical protein
VIARYTLEAYATLLTILIRQRTDQNCKARLDFSTPSQIARLESPAYVSEYRDYWYLHLVLVA